MESVSRCPGDPLEILSLYCPHFNLQLVMSSWLSVVSSRGWRDVLISGHGQPFASANSFGNVISRWAKEAGLTGCPLHGLRKACARRLAEAGCSTLEIMSITGHKSMAEVERYVRAANQKRMSQAAMEKVSGTQTYPRQDQSYPQGKKA